MKCGMSSECASWRAVATDSGEQHERAPSPCGSDQSSSVTAMTSSPRSRGEQRRHRAVDPAAHRDEGPALTRLVPARESGLPERGVHRVGRERGGVHLAGERPPSSFETSCAVRRAASTTLAFLTSSTVAEPAASAAPQPLASKPASVIVSPSTASAMRMRSPHGAPPAVPASGESVRRFFPRGALR